MENMDIQQIETMILDFWKHKCQIIERQYELPRDQIINCYLYDVIVVKFSLEVPRKTLFVSLKVGDNVFSGKILNETMNGNWEATEENIMHSLNEVDKICRLLLPDKYLLAFDKAYESK